VASTAKKTKGRKILFIPAVGAGQGIGHLKRCAAIVKKARGKAWLFLPDKELLPTAFVSSLPKTNILRYIPTSDLIKLIVTDLKQTELSLLSRYGKQAVLLGLDEGGSSRELFPYLIDTLPFTSRRSIPNAVFPYAADLVHESQKDFCFPFRRVLLSFGGEDPERLTKTLVDILLTHKIFKASAISLIQGPLFKSARWPQGVRVHADTNNIARLLKTHDLVITHFGLTCYEALAQGVPVILLNPTAYHDKLTRRAGLPAVGIKKPNVRKLIKLLHNKQLFRQILAENSHRRYDTEQSLLDFLIACEVKGSVSCPLCKKNLNRVVARFKERSYFRCSRCGMIYLLYCGSEHVRYTKSYFFDNYKRQYGRTYLEDFAFIQELGRERLREILKILKNNKQAKLLDIGCAYGPFLKAAALQGLDARGVDISAEAVRYVRKQLGIQCQTMDFEHIQARFMADNKKSCDVVSMWFVIEHVRNLHNILAVINSLLKEGGVFAFSTPSAKGISARKNRSRFLYNSPSDHFTVWTPQYVKKQLKLFGFTIKKIKITGHHVERFLPSKGLWLRFLKIFASVILVLSKLLCLGDTFEVYAVKESEYYDFT